MFDAEATRRQFLTGRAALQAIQSIGLQQTDYPGSPIADHGTAGYLVSYSRRAMACEFQVCLPYGQSPAAAEAAVAALDIVERLEAQLTIYRETSEVSQLNALAYQQAMAVEPGLFALLQQARQLWQQTAGAYDITTGKLSKLWGFAQRAGHLPDLAQIPLALAQCGTQHLQLDAAQQTARFTIPELELNLGSIGKGYALDRAAQLLREYEVENFALHGGNSSILVQGRSPGNDAWWIGVRDPLRPEQRLCEVALRDRAIGTSGAAVQFFIHQGKRYGHIIDPRTGWPAQETLSVTVLAPTAAQADALATGLYVMGRAAASDYLAKRPELAAMIFTPSPKAGQWELSLHNIGEQDLRLVDTATG